MQVKSYQVHDISVVTDKVLLDTETPISLYMKIRNLSVHSFLLESVEEGNNVGRFSLVGWGCRRSFIVKPGSETLFAELETLLASYQTAGKDAFNGFYGYMGYEAVCLIEPSVASSPRYGDLPLAYFFLPEVIAVFDKLSHQVTFIFNLEKNQTIDSEQQINSILSLPLDEVAFLPDQSDVSADRPFTSNVSKIQFERMIERAKAYIFSGDIFQVVLSQCFETPFKGDPFEVYRYLCSINPSPYMFYFNFGDQFTLMGTSPEIMLKKEKDKLTVRPIAGTRRRGATPQEDLQIEQELLLDDKENAEHLMLVDLARNDLNRTCQSDTVQVDSFRGIERYSHVMHIVSSVSGRMRPGQSVVSAIKGTFPAGTLSGAPKVRALQIIHELENSARQTYGGMVGYFGMNGDFDSCITIRSILVRGNTAFVQTGAGIVADSIPSMEVEETLNKARAMFRALNRSKG
ncbi:MAG: anthranilate synthase component I family protein [Candidatus Margulisiibacteriota bacterium]